MLLLKNPLMIFVIIAFVLVCACTSTSESSSSSSKNIQSVSPVATQKITAPESNINQDFTSIALTINDLPHGWMTSGKTINNETLYQSGFIYIGTGTAGIPLSFTITRYPTLEDAKKVIQQQRNEITNVRTDSLDIGKDAFGYQQIATTVVTFRRSNLIISLNTIAYPAIPISDLYKFASLVNSRIK